MHWTEIPAGTLNAGLLRFFNALGADAGHVLNWMKGPDFAERLAEFSKNFAFRPSRSYELAQAIMGTNMFGVKELTMTRLNQFPRECHLRQLNNVPFDQKTLEKHRDTHYLVASIESLERATWTLISKAPVPGSENLSWVDQQKLPRPWERIATYWELMRAFVAYSYQHGGKLFVDDPKKASMIRCSDQVNDQKDQCMFGWGPKKEHYGTLDPHHGEAAENVRIVTTIAPL